MRKIAGWTQPTDGQIRAGNYFKPRVDFQGIPIAIENPKGSTREGPGWKVKMHHPYGYIEATRGRDGDALDVYVGPDKKAPFAYVVHQRVAGDWGKWDEDKVMLGFRRRDEAIRAFLKQYDDKRFLGPVTKISVEGLKAILRAARRQRRTVVVPR